MNKSAKNMEVIYKAKQKHDAECPWGGEGKRIYMTGFDIERMGWEEGDVIAGLVLVIDTNLTTGRFRVECDAEPTPLEDLSEKLSDKDLVSV
jgi:hypothetical protein